MRTFRLLRCIQNHSTLGHDVTFVCWIRSSKNERRILRPFMWKTKNMNVDNSWKLKFIFCLVEITDEPLHVDKWSCVQYLQVLFDEVVNMSMVRILRLRWDRLNHSVKFSNFMQCHEFLSYVCGCSCIILVSLFRRKHKKVRYRNSYQRGSWVSGSALY
jgi:hypothetical protein